LIEIIRWIRDRRRTPVIAHAEEPDRTLGE
jgi:hypothetical protein